MADWLVAWLAWRLAATLNAERDGCDGDRANVDGITSRYLVAVPLLLLSTGDPEALVHSCTDSLLLLLRSLRLCRLCVLSCSDDLAPSRLPVSPAVPPSFSVFPSPPPSLSAASY